MKKTLSMALILALTMGLTASGFAAGSGAKITGMAQGLGYGYSDDGDDYVDLGEIYAQDEMVEYISLYTSMFSWDGEIDEDEDEGEGEGESGDDDVATPTDLTSSQIREARLDVRADSRNNRVVESVELNERESRIEITFKDELNGVEEIDFEFDVYLTINGRRQSDYGMTFAGTFTNPVIEVYESSGSVDISDGSVAMAMESIRELDVDIGNGVSITTRLTKDKRVSGSTTHTESRADEDVMEEYKDIAYAVALDTAGFSTASTVTFGYEYRGMYVYDEDLTYLGKAGDDLPFLDKYYLASSELDIPEDPIDVEPIDEPTEPTEPPATVPMIPAYPPNRNNNPSTGW